MRIQLNLRLALSASFEFQIIPTFIRVELANTRPAMHQLDLPLIILDVPKLEYRYFAQIRKHMHLRLMKGYPKALQPYLVYVLGNEATLHRLALRDYASGEWRDLFKTFNDSLDSELPSPEGFVYARHYL